MVSVVVRIVVHLSILDGISYSCYDIVFLVNCMQEVKHLEEDPESPSAAAETAPEDLYRGLRTSLSTLSKASLPSVPEELIAWAKRSREEFERAAAPRLTAIDAPPAKKARLEGQ